MTFRYSFSYTLSIWNSFVWLWIQFYCICIDECSPKCAIGKKQVKTYYKEKGFNFNSCLLISSSVSVMISSVLSVLCLYFLLWTFISWNKSLTYLIHRYLWYSDSTFLRSLCRRVTALMFWLVDIQLRFNILNCLCRAHCEIRREQCLRCWARVHMCYLTCTRHLIVSCLVPRHALVTYPVPRQVIMLCSIMW